MGKLDNTLIVYICGDNGTSPEGTLVRHLQSTDRLQRHPEGPRSAPDAALRTWGSDKTYPHMAVGWAWAFDSPFKWTKQGENSGIPVGNAPDIMDKDFTISAEITVPKGGAEGMIVTLGGRFGGYGLYLLEGKPVFVYNLLDLERFRWEGGVGGAVGEDLLGRALEPGKHTLVFDFKHDGPGPRKGGTGVFSVDGKELASKTLEHTIPLLMSIDETFDVGVDTRSSVDDSYQLPFRFTGSIDKLTFKLGRRSRRPPEKPSPGPKTRFEP